MEANACMLVRNNLLTQTWLEHFIDRLMKTYEKWKNAYMAYGLWLMA
jgi:hypothetical protein